MSKRHSQNWLDVGVAIAVTLFAAALVIVPPPNLDLWWLLAVGRRIVETHAYIYRDPFTFTVAGAPWSPQSYLSAIVFYALHAAAGMGAITALRIGLVALVSVMTLRAVRFAGVSWAMASPLMLLMLLTAHTRFADRGQLFEYVFLVWLVGFLLTCHERTGKSFFVLPVVVQLFWVQLHSSFLLGPVVAAIFFASEWIGSQVPFLTALHRRDPRRGLVLVLLMALVCAVNPNPHAFLIQPFDSAQHELMSRFTLEWKSPFDPAIASANFHPYYEILLAVAALAILLNLGRLPLGPVALLVATAVLSLQSHRFRVEFALVAVPMVALLLRLSPVPAWLRSRLRAPAPMWSIAAVAIAVALGFAERGRLTDRPVEDLDPDAALAFVVDNDIAMRPFHPIGFGSYMLWDLYGRRHTFIDGRNFDPGLYRDFLVAQTNPPALRSIIEKYRIDSFILPAPARADAGMRNIHQNLVAAHATWALVHMDPVAFVYVRSSSVDSTWLDAHAYRAYHPMTFEGKPHSADEFAAATRELERATVESPDFSPAWMDLGLARFARGDYDAASAAFRKATEIDPANVLAWNQLGRSAMTARRFDDAVAAFRRLAELVPRNPAAWVALAGAEATSGDTAGALEACNRALALDGNNAAALEMRRQLTSQPTP